MHERTFATLAKLDTIEWFTTVGQQTTDSALVLTSWKEALRHCTSNKWQNLCLEAANQFRGQIFGRDTARLNQWNTIVREVKIVTEPFVQRKCAAVVQTQALPEQFLHAVNWDMLHLAMEGEYADIFAPGFYASQAYWYLQGHFPCGWHGIFPNGKLIVY